MKHALKNIDPQQSMNEREHIEKIKRHILEIGDKINDHLTAYSDPEKIKEWRNYLWVFVSKFTSTWSWQRIKDLYKKFALLRDDEDQLQTSSSSSYMSGGQRMLNNSQTPNMKSSGYHRGSGNTPSSGFHGSGGYGGGRGPPDNRRDTPSSSYQKYKK